MLTPPLVGYLIYKFINNNKMTRTFLILSLIFISAVVAIFSLYQSPITLRPNSQITNRDIRGMNWLIIHKNRELKTADIMTPVFRYSDLIYGCGYREERRDLYRDLIFPDHFGFGRDNILPIDEDRYLVITEFDFKTHTEVLKDLDKFSKEDFIKVNYCTNVDKIYENGEFRTYFVHKND